jgi:electron transfer flavoprotein alpha subunit
MAVLVFAENSNGTFKKSEFEAVTYASKVAAVKGTEVIAVTLGEIADDVVASLGNYGASKVLKEGNSKLNNLDGKAYAKVIAAVAEANGADTVIMSYGITGKHVAGRVAVKLGASIVPGANALPEGSSVKKSVFSGKAYMNLELKAAKNVIAVTPNSITVEESGAACAVEAFDAGLTDTDFSVVVKEVKKVEGRTPLTEAELVVSAGRGLKGPENWGMVEEMAEILGATTACSRPVADMDWRPHGEHVGQTGVAIRPDLYIAIGISGAIQHLAGVNQSKVIVVINKDPEAPFFKAADYGIIGDAFEVVPKLNAALKEHKANN